MTEIIEVNLDDDVILILALEAHRLDMKLNDFILQVLKDYIARNLK